MKDRKSHRSLGPLRSIYFLRIIITGLGFGILMAFEQLPVDTSRVAVIIASVGLLASPHLTYLFHISARSYSTTMLFKRIEYRALIFDNFIFGMCIPIVHFYPMAALAFSLGPISNLIQVGGLRLLVRGFYWLPIGIVFGLFFTGIHFYGEVNVTLIVLSVLVLVIHNITQVYLGFLSALRVIRAKRQLDDAYAELEVEKQRSDELLLNILPEEIAQELKEKGEAEARIFENVSILFTDFKDFTQISQQLSARELVTEINIYFKRFDEICLKHDLEKIKTIGDAYMAVGGLPVATESSAKNTVKAALEMEAFVLERKKEEHVMGRERFEMRVGIHTGNVVAGIVGVNKFQYDIWGDTVNLASRVESHGEAGKVNISERTYDIIKQDPEFEFESRGEVLVKGKGAIKMYFVSQT